MRFLKNWVAFVILFQDCGMLYKKLGVCPTNMLLVGSEAFITPVYTRIQCNSGASGERVVQSAWHAIIGSARATIKRAIWKTRVIPSHSKASVTFIVAAFSCGTVAECWRVRQGEPFCASIGFATSLSQTERCAYAHSSRCGKKKETLDFHRCAAIEDAASI